MKTSAEIALLKNTRRNITKICIKQAHNILGIFVLLAAGDQIFNKVHHSTYKKIYQIGHIKIKSNRGEKLIYIYRKIFYVFSIKLPQLSQRKN